MKNIKLTYFLFLFFNQNYYSFKENQSNNNNDTKKIAAILIFTSLPLIIYIATKKKLNVEKPQLPDNKENKEIKTHRDIKNDIKEELEKIKKDNEKIIEELKEKHHQDFKKQRKELFLEKSDELLEIKNKNMELYELIIKNIKNIDFFYNLIIPIFPDDGISTFRYNNMATKYKGTSLEFINQDNKIKKYLISYKDKSTVKPKNISCNNEEWKVFLNDLYFVNNCEDLLIHIPRKDDKVQIFFKNSLDNSNNKIIEKEISKYIDITNNIKQATSEIIRNNEKIRSELEDNQKKDFKKKAKN